MIHTSTCRMYKKPTGNWTINIKKDFAKKLNFDLRHDLIVYYDDEINEMCIREIKIKKGE